MSSEQNERAASNFQAKSVNATSLSEILPSQVKDERFVYWPPNSAEVEKEKGGKWMIFLNGKFDLLDPYWLALKPLCEKGLIYKLRATTSIAGAGGAINCYTENANDKEGVRRAADAIREAIDMDHIIHYKTNQASEDGQFLCEGKKSVSKYLHTVKCVLYEKCENLRWKSILRKS